ncbi:MAG: VOC family protein, partial [Pseudomonadota bacterium]
DADAVAAFYERLFAWRLEPNETAAGVTPVRNARGQTVSEIHQLPDEVRGKFEFWGVHFAVTDIAKAKQAALGAGGEALYEAGDSILLKDRDGAAFFIAPAATKGRSGGTDQALTDGSGSSWPWKTVLALAALWTAILMQIDIVWGVLFLMWTLPALRSGQTYFVEHIQRRTNPALFWAIVGTWIVLSIYLIVVGLGLAS